MIWGKGVAFRKMPPLAMIQSIVVIDRKNPQAPMPARLVPLSAWASMVRMDHKVTPGQWYFFMDFETQPTGLHIYPIPDKQMIVKVRYLPKVVEI